MNMKQLKYIFIGCLSLLMGCQQEELWQDTIDYPDSNGLQLNIKTDGMMDQFMVTTRGTDVKTPEEQEIKSLHVFIFDTEGNYLGTKDEHRYQGYRSITGGKTVMNIDREGWLDNEKATNATIIVVANVEEGTFTVNTADTPPTNIINRDALANFKYKPLIQRLVTSLPESGMPMYGRVDNVDLTKSNTSSSILIPMKALMSRIDVSLQINSTNSDVTGNLPELTVTECKVLNVPEATLFSANEGAETDLSDNAMGKKEYSFPATALKTINNKKGKLEYTFYTFENLQEPADSNYDYPDGITEEEKQQYKPELADKDNSMAFKLSGIYITYNGASYDATYTLYLGANHTNDFKVMRNKQYKNNVTIKGIVKAGNNPEHITFDTRVNVSASNPYFISMLKDRTLDSHFNVVPMDVYFFNTNPSNPNPPKQTMKVEILEPTNASWVRMERIPAENMENGTVPSISTGGPELMATGSQWHAGNGKRKYFTTDLVTTTLSGNTEMTVENSRDRIYFYIDENLDVWHLGTTEERTRTATVKMTYYEDEVEKGTRELVLEQAKLLEVKFIQGDSGDEGEGMVDRVFYVEAYEEYLNHGDPLDEYTNNQVFTGLPWEEYSGGSGSEIPRLNFGTLFNPKRVRCQDNFYWGHAFTTEIVNRAEKDVRDLDLNTKPITAAGYCYMKNKRNLDGSVSNHKWYLPGIRELERILRHYYIEYPEFQNNYYWSSAAGEGGSFLDGYQSLNNARATKAYIKDGEFKYYNSGTSNPYTGENGEGGFAPRKTSLRIRAARYDNIPQ